MNSFRNSSRVGFGQSVTLASGLALVFACLFVLAGTASAASVECSGSLKPDKTSFSENALEYKVSCTEEVLGYSIVSNREIGYFSTEVIVLKGKDVAEGEAFTCEGAIPGNGMGCYGKKSANNTVVGSLATTDELCEANTQPKFWAVALTTQEAKGKPFPLTSEPFALNIRCKTLNAKAKAKAKANKVCAKVGKAKNKKAKTKARKRCKTAKAQVRRLVKA